MIQKEINITYTEYDSLDQMKDADKDLALAAVKASENAYSPYSHFNVGAAVRLSNGEIVCGSNQENIAYPSGLCAERTAMFYASAKYPEESMKAIAIAGMQNGIICESPATPCGACRQVMAEYQTRGKHPMCVILVGAKKIWKFQKVDDILPLIFDSLK